MTSVRVAYFHNFTPLGETLARSPLAMPDVEMTFVGSVDPNAATATNDGEFAQLVADRSIVCSSAAMLVQTETLATLRAFKPHLIVVATFRYKLPAAVLEIPSLAAINVHPSLLPRYRGACPDYWCIRNGDTETGVTIHHLAAQFDCGDIIAQQSFPLSATDTGLSLTYKTIEVAKPLLDDVVRGYATGELPVRVAQDEALATRAPVPRDAELRIQWTDSAENIERNVRAAYPGYEAYTLCGDERVLLRSARVYEYPGLLPGKMHHDSTTKRLLVGTGEKTLEVLSVMASEKRSLRGEQFFLTRSLGEFAAFH